LNVAAAGLTSEEAPSEGLGSGVSEDAIRDFLEGPFCELLAVPSGYPLHPNKVPKKKTLDNAVKYL
jgi:hypothetical protein